MKNVRANCNLFFIGKFASSKIVTQDMYEQVSNVLTEEQTLQDALLLFQQSNAKTLPVMRQYELIGILELNQIYTIHQVLNKSGKQKSSIFNGIKKWTNGKD